MTIKFLSFALVGYFAMNFKNPLGEAFAVWLTKLTTEFAAYFITSVGIPIKINGTVIEIANESLMISLECTAIYLMILFAALIIAYPASKRDKAIGLTIGLPLIFTINQIRLLMIAFVAYNYPYILQKLHDYVWQVLFLILIFGLWTFWMEALVKREPKAPIRG